MTDEETKNTPVKPILLQPNSWAAGLTKGLKQFQINIWTLKIQAMVVEDVPRSRKNGEKRMPKQTARENTSIY